MKLNLGLNEHHDISGVSLKSTADFDTVSLPAIQSGIVNNTLRLEGIPLFFKSLSLFNNAFMLQFPLDFFEFNLMKGDALVLINYTHQVEAILTTIERYNRDRQVKIEDIKSNILENTRIRKQDIEWLESGCYSFNSTATQYCVYIEKTEKKKFVFMFFADGQSKKLFCTLRCDVDKSNAFYSIGKGILTTVKAI